MKSVFVPLIITFGVTALADFVQRGGLRASVVIGNAVYATFMVLASEVEPRIANAFAWVVVITVLLTSGSVVFQGIQKGIQ